MIKICINCGKEYKTRNRNKRSVTCSNSCAKEYMKNFRQTYLKNYKKKHHKP